MWAQLNISMCAKYLCADIYHLVYAKNSERNILSNICIIAFEEMHDPVDCAGQQTSPCKWQRFSL